ncbi:MAG: hypothetical protein J6Y93_02235, partial [Treponema sp.]|nr:hypothetical protein [Treponema sp.]
TSSKGLIQNTSYITTAQRSAASSEVSESAVLSEPRIKHLPQLKAPGKVDLSQKKFASRAVSGTESKGTDYSIGDVKYFYIDTDVDISKFEKRKTVLRAKNDVCRVWIADGCYTGGYSREKYVNSSVAEDIASRFMAYYEHERHIFGEEGEDLIQETGMNQGKIGDLMPDSYVNIVIYDIGADYGKTERCGITGYFYSKDYWVPLKNSRSSAQYSNKGKFFYIDSAFCNYISDSRPDAPDSVAFAGYGNTASDTAVTTLYHEFQHMISFGRNDYDDEPAWYNEMLSMLAEDMFSQSLNTGFNDSPVGARLPLFNESYFVSGIDEWQSDPLTIFSYSTAYAFGAWLCRNYGGPAFVKDLCECTKKGNHLNGMDAVKAVIKERTGENVSSNQIYRRFIQSCIFRNSFANSNGLYTFYKDAGGSIEYDGKTSVMNKIDIFSNELCDLENNTDDKQLGPRIFANGYLSDGLSYEKKTVYNSELRPHGFVIHFAGIAETDSVTLNFSERKTQAEDIMIYIQDKFKN